jgi:hypothetical protein
MVFSSTIVKFESTLYPRFKKRAALKNRFLGLSTFLEVVIADLKFKRSTSGKRASTN